HDPAAAPGLELDDAGAHREQRVVAADADAVTGTEARAALAHDDLATGHPLAAEYLDAQHLRVRVTPVAAGAEPLLVSHYESSFAAAASALSAVSFLADEAFLAAGLRLSIFTSSTSSLVSSERCPRRRRYPFFGRYLKTRSFSPRRCSVTFAS